MNGKWLGIVFWLMGMAMYSQAQTFFIVRHAEKDLQVADNPPLTPIGLERAERLADRLVDQKIQHIFSTETIRTRSTALPLAKKLQLPIQIYQGADQTRFIDSLKNFSSNALIVGHTNTMHHVINGLAEKMILEGPLDETIYDRIYEVKRRKLGKPLVVIHTF